MTSYNFYSRVLSMVLVALLTGLSSSPVWANWQRCTGFAEASLEKVIESLPYIEGLAKETTPTLLVKQQGASKKIVVLMQVESPMVYGELVEKLKDIDQDYLRSMRDKTVRYFKSRRFICHALACFSVLGGVVGGNLSAQGPFGPAGGAIPGALAGAISTLFGFIPFAGSFNDRPIGQTPKATKKALKRFLEAPSKDTQVMFLVTQKGSRGMTEQIADILSAHNVQQLNRPEMRVILDQARSKHGLYQEKQTEIERQNQELAQLNQEAAQRRAALAKLTQEGLVKQDGDVEMDIPKSRIMGQINSPTHKISLSRLMPTSVADVSIFLNALPDLALLGFKDAKRVLANKSVFLISTFSSGDNDRSLGVLFFDDGKAVVRFKSDIPPEKVEEIKNRIYASLDDYQHVSPNYHPQNIDDGLVIAASVKQMDAHEKLLTDIAADLNEAPEAPVERVRVRQ